MIRTLTLLFFALTLTAAGFLRANVELDYFKVEQESNGYRIAWKAKIEEDVLLYELYRKTAYAPDFVKIHALPPHGVGKEYTFKDDQVYKSASELMDYRLDVVYTNGLRQQKATQPVSYSSTAIRRTWGSIKAMFQ